MGYKAAVVGCTGYVGGELLRLLNNHTRVSIGAITAHSNAGVRLGDVQPHLSSIADVIVKDTTIENLEEHDVIFLALPHGASAELAAQIDPDVLVIDCGADFRLASTQDWEKYYGTPHAGTWPYGLPELPGQRAILSEARRIAVPGCYPTASTLGLAPAVVNNLVDSSDLVIVAASGTSGAGKALKPNLLGSEIMGSAAAYSVGGVHRHVPEILQNLRGLGATDPTLSFTPILVPMPRGILATCTASIRAGITEDEVRKAYSDFYQDEPFVTLLPEGQWPTTAAVLGSNSVLIQFGLDSEAGRLTIISAIDNLTKGTAGGAIQSMNLALGFPETEGLPMNGVAP
ncbi:MAG: N-acetyl-gamma-glutamyl-phosphate reductase [Propionibacteriaceae bacterium]|jgi:N-acetyl-gamma-glutamyl-phosphate reductase|nr:N-acetyl-gamma-glutamyl-phosphate reductase [Propionibacteriaceae bacterium]